MHHCYILLIPINGTKNSNTVWIWNLNSSSLRKVLTVTTHLLLGQKIKKLLEKPNLLGSKHEAQFWTNFVSQCFHPALYNCHKCGLPPCHILCIHFIHFFLISRAQYFSLNEQSLTNAKEKHAVFNCIILSLTCILFSTRKNVQRRIVLIFSLNQELFFLGFFS